MKLSSFDLCRVINSFLTSTLISLETSLTNEREREKYVLYLIEKDRKEKIF